MTNTKPQQYTIQRRLLRALDLLKQRVGGLLANSFQLQKVVFFQVVDISNRVDQRSPCRSFGSSTVIRLLNRLLGRMLGNRMAEQLCNHHFAQALDIHHAARSEVPQLFFESSRTACIDATPIYLTLFAHKLRLAARTMLGKRNRTALNVRFLLLNHTSDLGNHITTTLHLDDVADPHPEPLNLIRIVQGRARHRGSANKHRRQRSHRSHLPRPADLKQHILEPRRPRSRRKLIRNRPSRSLSCKTQPLLLRNSVHLHHNAINLVPQRVPQRLRLSNKLHNLIDASYSPRMLIHSEIPPFARRSSASDCSGNSASPSCSSRYA